jgi:transcriptional regulator with XRE-family HTH domain
MASKTAGRVLSEFGHRVRTKRKALGLSQEEFANEAGLDRTYISGIERGKRNAALINIEKIADALNVRIKDLF